MTGNKIVYKKQKNIHDIGLATFPYAEVLGHDKNFYPLKSFLNQEYPGALKANQCESGNTWYQSDGKSKGREEDTS